TVEGIGNVKKLHPVQERLARGHGTQCGFCSPGFVMSAYTLLRNNPNPSTREINQAIKGGKIDLIIPASFTLRPFDSVKCPCKEQSSGPDKEKLLTFDDFPKFDESQEIVFPPLFIMESEDSDGDIFLEGRRVTLHAPSELQVFEEHLRSNKEAKIISSGLITRLITSHSSDDTKIVWTSTHRLKTLSEVLVFDKEMSLGANLTITEFVDAVDKYCDPMIAKPIRKLFDKYSSLQVANVASWVGGFVSGSSDVSALLLALNPSMTIRDTAGVHEFRRVSDLIDGNGKVKLENSQFIISMSFPRTEDALRLFTFKQGARLGPDSTIVNCVAALHVKENIETARIAVSFGSRAILCEKLWKELCGK
ncbi:unnamed protein product, partial [Strongylus vulgaris]